MQLKLSFTALLAGVLLALSAQDVEAVPVMRRNAGLVTLPLKRVEQSRSEVHPAIYLQQHVNRGVRRLARMTGRDAPSEVELRENLQKRVLSLENDPLAKRYLPFHPPKFDDRSEEDALDKRFNRGGTGSRLGALAGRAGGRKGGKKGKKIAAGAAAGGAAGAAAGAATGSGKAASTGASNATDTTGSEDAAGALPDTVTAANTPTADNSLGLNIEANDVGYLATVQLGTPPQNFLLLMDSGSADTWVGSEACQSDQGGDCGNHNFLGSKSSSSFKATAQQFAVTYGTGSVSGTVITDNMLVAGLALPAHTFGVATTESVDFADDSVPFDGLMGLAQSSLSQEKTLTPPESLAKAGLITDAITSFKIPRLADNLNDGEITFGGLDDTKFDSATLVTLPNVNTQGFWEGAVDAATVDGKDTGLQGRTAILDTGTTLIIMPAADATAVHNLIDGAKADGQGGFTVPCTTTASVAFTFGGQAFTIDPRDLAFTPATNDPNGDCISGISSGNIGGATEWLVGDVFLKNAYFSTDVTKNTVSLAKLK